MRSEFRAELQKMRMEFGAKLTDVKTDYRTEFASLRGEMHKTTAGAVKWMAGIALTTMLVNVAVLTFVLRTAA
jgi:hypothetical protein